MWYLAHTQVQSISIMVFSGSTLWLTARRYPTHQFEYERRVRVVNKHLTPILLFWQRQRWLLPGALLDHPEQQFPV